MGGENEETLAKVNGLVVGFFWIYTNEKKMCFCPEDRFQNK